MYTHECPTHHLQDSDKSGRTRAWTSHSGREVTTHKVSDTDGMLRFIICHYEWLKLHVDHGLHHFDFDIAIR